MRSYILFTVLTVFLNVTNAEAKFEVHEWGTFTSLVGSDGRTQHGMYHEDEKLPDFVHPFGATQDFPVVRATPPPQPPKFPLPQPDPCPVISKSCFSHQFFEVNQITQKMETPVIYFYTDQRRDVEVNVKFPEGIITDTFPAPVKTYPKFSDNPELGNGDTTFQVQVLPTEFGKLPGSGLGNIYFHARNAKSSVVKSGNNEYEKFIFYRGLGRFQPKISIRSRNGNLKLSSDALSKLPQASYLVHVDEKGHGQMMLVSRFGTQSDPQNLSATVMNYQLRRLSDHRSPLSDPNILSGGNAKAALVSSLVKAGLYQDEAAAMVTTWENGYLKVPGLRLLYILPRGEADEILPLTITPAPEKLERAFVGRIEIMLDTEENALLDDFIRTKTLNLAKLGRFAESMIHRLREVYLKRMFDLNQMPELLNVFDEYIDESRRGANATTTEVGT